MRLGPLALIFLVLTGLLIGLSIAGLPPLITLLVIAGLPALYLVFFHPRIVIAALLCVAPFNIVWIGVGVTTLEIIYVSAYVLIIASWGLKKMLEVIFEGRTESLSSPITLPLFAFLSVSILSFIIGVLREHKIWQCGSDLNAIMCYGLCFIMLEEIKDKRELYRLFTLVVISAALGLIRGLYYLIVTNPPVDIGIEIIYQGLSRLRNSSIFALIMFMFSVAMVVILPKGKRRRVFEALALFFGAMAILSFARSIWIASIFGLAYLFLTALPKHKPYFIKLILIGIVAVSVYIAVAMSVPTANPLYKSVYAIEKRYESVFTAKEEPSIMTRGSEWQAAMRKALEHPFLGNGLGTEFTYFRYDIWLGTPRWDTTRYIHNAYLYLFLNMGLAGLVLFLWFCFSFIKYGLKVYWSLGQSLDKALALGIITSFASLMVVSLAGPFLASPIVTMWLGFFAGALIIIDRSNKSTVPALPAGRHSQQSTE